MLCAKAALTKRTRALYRYSAPEGNQLRLPFFSISGRLMLGNNFLWQKLLAGQISEKWIGRALGGIIELYKELGTSLAYKTGIQNSSACRG